MTASPGRDSGRPPTSAQPTSAQPSRAQPSRALLPIAALLLALLTACGSGDSGSDAGQGGSRTSCDLTGCSITFVRDGTPEVSVLGVPAKLIGVDGNVATVEVAGQQVTLPVGGEAQSEGFTVRLERATDAEVVVRVTHGLGGGGG